MPEGDTVWRTARRLHEALAGQVLTRSDLRVPRFATADLTGRRVLDVTPRGKHLLTRIEGGLTLHSHLRMDGAWQVYAPGRALARRPRPPDPGDPRHRGPHRGRLPPARAGAAPHHGGGTGRRPSRPRPARARTGTRTGPWTTCSRDPGRALGEALLDQRNLAGIGNVYKSELCFLLGVTPWLPGRRAAPGPGRPAARPREKAAGRQPRSLCTGHHGPAATSICSSTAAPRARVCAAEPRSGSPTRATAPASAPPTGAPAASRARPPRRTGTRRRGSAPHRRLTVRRRHVVVPREPALTRARAVGPRGHPVRRGRSASGPRATSSAPGGKPARTEPLMPRTPPPGSRR